MTSPRNQPRPISHGFSAEIQKHLIETRTLKPPPPSSPPPANYSQPNGWFTNACIRAKWTSGRKKVLVRMDQRTFIKQKRLKRERNVRGGRFSDFMNQEFSLLAEKQKYNRKTAKYWYDGRRGWLYILTGSTFRITTDTGCI